MSRKAIIRALDAQYTAAMDADAAASYLTDTTNGTPTYRKLTGNDLRIWAISNEADYATIKAASTGGNNAARIAEMLVEDPASVLDMGDATVAAIVESMQTGGLISEAGKAALYATAREDHSLAQMAGVSNLEAADIVEARA